ncbi:MAG: hypothetical protein ACRCXH_01590 [Shewanella sp.]
MTYDFSTITEVQLKRGSHKSAKDGLCFLEMVSWFAGEEHSDKPECACPVLAAYGIKINDRMPDDLRDTLLKPLVPFMAGTRGTAIHQARRVEFFARWTVNHILPIALEGIGCTGSAVQCRNANSLDEVQIAAHAAVAAVAAHAAVDAADVDAADAAVAAFTYAAAYAFTYSATVDVTSIWEMAVEGLRQAILIGPHEGFVSTVNIAERHKDLRAMAMAD